MPWLRALIAGLWCGLLEAGPPQDPYFAARPAIRAQGPDDGLPNPTVHDLVRDRVGRLWAGTQDGAAVLSSGSWMPVRIPDSPSQFVRALLPTREGGMWLGTQDGGLWRLEAGVWTSYRAGRELPSDRVNALSEGLGERGRQVVWAATSQGVAKFDGERWTTLPIPKDIADSWVWRVREIRTPAGDPQVWVLTQNAVATYTKGRWERLGPAQGFRGQGANDLLVYPGPRNTQELWVSCWGVGLEHWNGRAWIHHGPAEGFPSRNPTCLSLSRDPDGSPVVWAGSFDGGLAWFKEGRWHALGPEQGLPSVGVYAMLPVPAGSPEMLVGLRGEGVGFLDRAGWRTLDQGHGVVGREVTAILQSTADGTWWVGTDRGLMRWEGERFRLLTEKEGLAGNYVNALAEISTGPAPGIYVAGIRGLSHLEGGRWRTIGPERGLPLGQTICLGEGPAPEGGRTLWVGTERGLALWRKDRFHLLTTAEGLPHNWIYAIHETVDARGVSSLWVGTRGGGVGRLSQGRWTTFGTERGIPNPSVYAVRDTVGKDGRRWIWAGTFGGGLARLEAEHPNPRWRTFGSKDLPGLQSLTILRVEVDRRGRLYLTTPRGVARVTLEEGLDGPVPAKVETFTAGDGLPSTACTYGASFVDRGGRVWVGTAKGLGIFDPAIERPREPAYPPLIEDVRQGGSLLDPAISHTFPARKASFTFRFGLPSVYRTEDIRYRTQMEGLEPQPADWASESWRDFPTLPPGPYRFRVWARDAVGRETGPAEWAFRIQPPLWRSPLALAAYALLLGGLSVLVTRLRTRLLEARNRSLRALVSERTRTLELEVQQRRVAERTKDEFVSVVSHELRTPLTSIRGAVNLLSSGALDALPQERRDLFAIASRNIERLHSLVNDLLDVQKLESGLLELDIRSVSLHDAVARALENIQPYAEDLGVKIAAPPPGKDLHVRADPQRLEQVFANLLSNAAKFSPKGGTVTLSLSPSDVDVLVAVHNTGEPIPAAFSHRIFQKFAQADSSTTRKAQGTGLGLAITQSLVQGMGGRIGFESDEDGTTFHFTLMRG